ncbi:MAG: cation diffusion facilitator family transporter [Acidobacteriota bacterium]|nr:MAG: cation diffusion facilitator family transporter [Acidobacteriota bacterium]
MTATNASQGTRRAMVLAFLLTSSFMMAELVGGILANSLALIADAGHMVADAAALGLGLFAMWIACHPHTERRTFGFHRAEILAALVNGSLLVGIALFVSYHAVERLREAQQVASGPVLIIAALGLVVNVVALRILGGHRHANLNVRGAFLHVLGDALGSIGVLISGLVIHFTGWMPADAIVSLFIATLILVSGWRLVRETISVLLESSPRYLDTDVLRRDLIEIGGVRDVHDLHVWTVTSGFVSLSAHAEVTSSDIADEVLRNATVLLRERYGIRHVTIQLETSQIHDELEHCCLGEHEPSLSFRRFLNQS